jgi:hypothetical protein
MPVTGGITTLDQADEEGTVKYIVINRLAPGVDNAKKALEVFLKVGLPAGTEITYAGTDGKTFINIVDTESPDITASGTFAPFFEEATVIPVVALDAAWIEAIQAAQANWG